MSSRKREIDEVENKKYIKSVGLNTSRRIILNPKVEENDDIKQII